jgi:hypothetical protein
MNPRTLFDSLLHAEHEDEVTAILRKAGYDSDDPDTWAPLGQVENNFGTVGNQQADATAALVEKIINSIDAVLMAECFKRGIDPESPMAPQSMPEAVERFFGIREGKLENITPTERTKLAERIHLVAVGSKSEPAYLVIDDGEGQSPRRFPDTFVSLSRSNKMRIPFVQGKFNAGGTGILQFCGNRNYQLIASRRNPKAPGDKDDPTSLDWGFTLVRRMRPAGNRRSSSYVYLAPKGSIPSFKADSIRVLPGAARGANQPPEAYSSDLKHGTCVKLYNYEWRARSTATTEARYELERFLYSPCLPFRITETRSYRANYYSTTVQGIFVSIAASKSGQGDIKVEAGFPAGGDVSLPATGRLPYTIVAFEETTDPRHLPHGVHFTVNGQVHGSLAADFVSRRLKFDYLRDHLLVAVDCTRMEPGVREDVFMASRDRIRHNEVTDALAGALERELRDHAGLRALNAARRAKRIEESLQDDKEAAEVLQYLLHLDSSLASILGLGDKLVAKTGVGPVPQFHGKRFPTYFRLAKFQEGQLYVRECPANKSCRVEFVTDATNDYFNRPESPGVLALAPDSACEYTTLWNGVFSTRWRPPEGAKVGDLVDVSVSVNDEHRPSNGGPFENRFKIRVAPADTNGSGPGRKSEKGVNPKGKNVAPQLSMPQITEVTEADWGNWKFDQFTGLRIRNAEEGKGYDFLLNVDNVHAKDQLKRAQPSEHGLIRYWFKYGLALCALGILQEDKRRLAAEAKDEKGEEPEEPDLDAIGLQTDGIARVIVPVIRTLPRGPQN